ncbi:MAG: uL15m family ribosomal protein [Candidatus Woesearchaeota archaeon]|nr:uL15m family ribosomal protein [Candidatus Woesearchaeota archaeon]
MVARREKKRKKYRGHTTHGWGSKKKHRGAGNRGGRGKAGTGKRADQLKSLVFKLYGNTYFGKKGFRIPQKIKKHAYMINIADLPEGKEIDLTKLGYTKLLSRGNVTRAIKITVEGCSKKAKEKIEKAGGSIILKE